MLLGWLITALAATLGAPFWFDIISRLVPLRGSGKPPSPPTAPAPSAASPPPPAALAAAPAATTATEVRTAGTTAVLAPASGAADACARNDFEARQLNEVDLQALQLALGLDATAITGLLDEPTRQALRQWQLTHHRPANGEFDIDTVMTLLYPDQP